MSSDCSVRMLCAIRWDSSRAACWVMWLDSSVATAPGSTSETRTPRAVTSCRSDSLKAFTAHLLAL
jgi:hypothetical protein